MFRVRLSCTNLVIRRSGRCSTALSHPGSWTCCRWAQVISLRSRRPFLLLQLLVSLFNGAIALVLLLIAPLGLAAVITLTLLITASTFLTGLGGGVLQRWLEGAEGQRGDSGISVSARRSLNPGTWRLPRR